METKGHYLIVGLFVVGFAIGGIIFAFWLKNKTAEDGLPYSAYFSSSVNGLTKGSPVLFQGVPIGNVTKISIDEKAQNKVRIDMAIDPKFKIRKDTRAQLEMKGITGGLVIQIKNGDPNAELMLPTRDDPSPVLSSTPSQVEEIFDSAPDVVKGIADLAQNLNALFNKENRDNISDIIKNLNDITGGLATKKEGDKNFVEKLDETLSSALTNFGKFSREAELLIAQNRDSIQDFTGSGLYDFSQTIKDLRDMINAITRVMRKVESSNLLFGDESKGVPAK